MRVAVFQVLYLAYPSIAGVRLLIDEVRACGEAEVLLCTLKALIGELTNEWDGDSPAEVVRGVDNDELADGLSSRKGTTTTVDFRPFS